MLAKTMTATAWAAVLSDPKAKFTLEEFSVIEQLMMRDHEQRVMQPIMDSVARSLAAMTSSMARLDGRLERIELYLHRKDPEYPLSQLEAPEYRGFKKLVKEYNANQRAIAEGGGAEDD